MELEGARLKRQTFQLGFALGLVALSGLVAFAGILMLALGTEKWLRDLTDPVSSLLITGALLLIGAGGMGLWIRRLMR